MAANFPEETSTDTRSLLERLHARWLGPIFGIVGVVAAIVGIVVGVRSCTSDGAPANDPEGAVRTVGQPPSSGRLYENSKVSRGSGPPRPTFTLDRVSPVGVLNSITDNPAYGDERNFTQCRLGDEPNSSYGDTVSATDGDVIHVYVILDNGSTSSAAAIINTRMQLIVDRGPTDDPGIQVEFYGTRESDGTDQKVWDGCGVNSDRPLRLVLVPGSGRATTGKGAAPAMVDDRVIIGDTMIPAVAGLSQVGVVPGSTTSWGFFTFDLLAVASTNA